MNKTEILVVGNNQSTRQTVINEINRYAAWNGVAVTAGEDAIEKFHQRTIDLVLLLNDIAKTEEIKLNKIFSHQNPDVILIKQNVAENGSIGEIISAALKQHERQRKPAISFVDDVLKNAGLNIVIQ